MLLMFFHFILEGQFQESNLQVFVFMSKAVLLYLYLV